MEFQILLSALVILNTILFCTIGFVFEASPIYLIGFLVISLILFRRQINEFRFKSLFTSKSAYILFLLLITFFQFFSAHYRYSGSIVNSQGKVERVKNQSFKYPVISDEWYSYSYVDRKLKYDKSFFLNPLVSWDEPIFNPQFAFHSLIAGIAKVLPAWDPSHYVQIGILINTLIVLMFFILLRSYGVGYRYSFVFSLAFSQTLHSSVVATFWSLLAINIGVLFLIISLIVLKQSGMKSKLFSISCLLTTAFYPPLTLHHFGILSAFTNISKKLLAIMGITVFLILSLLFVFNSQSILFYIQNGIVFQRQGSEVQDIVYFWDMVPWYITVVLIVCSFQLRQKHKGPIILLAILIFQSLVYNFTSYRFLLDQPRLLFLLAMVLCFVAGLLFNDINVKEKYKNSLVLLMVLFIGYRTLNYAEANNWQSVNSSVSGRSVMSAPPMNRYFIDEELRLCKIIRHKHLVSTPWKTTVLSSVCEAYPIFLKSGLISKHAFKWPRGGVDNLSCRQFKDAAPIKGDIYLYTRGKYSCDNLEFLMQLNTSFNLYKLIN